jgi:hypothetical protein
MLVMIPLGRKIDRERDAGEVNRRGELCVLHRLREPSDRLAIAINLPLVGLLVLID